MSFGTTKARSPSGRRDAGSVTVATTTYQSASATPDTQALCPVSRQPDPVGTAVVASPRTSLPACGSDMQKAPRVCPAPSGTSNSRRCSAVPPTNTGAAGSRDSSSISPTALLY